MSLHYLLDGYNVINQIPTLAQKKLEDSRLELIRLIETCHPQGSPRNSVTIVFDGKSGIWGSESRSTVKTIFTQGETADDKIKRIVSQAKNKKQFVVVTNDREIIYDVRPQGARVMSVEEFAAKLHARKKGDTRGSLPQRRTRTRKGKSKTQTTESKKPIPKSTEHKITEELGDIWLKKKDKS